MLSRSRVKYIQSLYHKKFRDESGYYLIEGPKMLDEFFGQAPETLLEIFATSDWIRSRSVHLSTFAGSIVEVSEVELKKLSQLSTPNQVLALVKQSAPSALPSSALTILLETMQDPGNLGTIIRLADWFGINSVVCSNDTVDAYNFKTVQSTMGSILRVNLLYTDLKEWILSQPGLTIYAAVLDGQPVEQIARPAKGALLVGNESKGISKELLALPVTRISIPGKGRAESLNAAVATGILLSWMT